MSHFKLIHKDFKQEDFSKFEAKCSQDLKELMFPVKYITGDIVGLKMLKVKRKRKMMIALPYLPTFLCPKTVFNFQLVKYPRLFWI